MPLLDQLKQGILRNDFSVMPSALSEVRGKAGSNSSPSFVVLLKINNGKELFQQAVIPMFPLGKVCTLVFLSPNLKHQHNSARAPLTSCSVAVLSLKGGKPPCQASSFDSVQITLNLKTSFHNMQNMKLGYFPSITVMV